MITTQVEKDFYRLKKAQDLDPLLDLIGDSRYVLLGEASHGTHEYYAWRMAITKRLILEKDFSFIAVEGDWPDCYSLNSYIKNYPNSGKDAREAMKVFDRWPTWLWANWEVVALAEWLRKHNNGLPDDKKIGFYGLDVYSLTQSMQTLIQYLRRQDPVAARLAIRAFRCFEPYREGHDYARAMLQLSPHCVDEVIELLKEVIKRSRYYDPEHEAALNAEMNARVVANAERYYRSMITFHNASWNVRDSHMADTLETLMRYHGKKSKAIVWEHNTHVGDARYTSMKDSGMWSVGQLVRENHLRDSGVCIVGFASYEGSVIAAREWGGKMERMVVPPAVPGSIEHNLHYHAATDKLILLNRDSWRKRLGEYKPQRAIGVIYNPENEKSNYVPTLMPYRYDALIYIDHSSALHPLYMEPYGNEIPETYPFEL